MQGCGGQDEQCRFHCSTTRYAPVLSLLLFHFFLFFVLFFLWRLIFFCSYTTHTLYYCRRAHCSRRRYQPPDETRYCWSLSRLFYYIFFYFLLFIYLFFILSSIRWDSTYDSALRFRTRHCLFATMQVRFEYSRCYG